MAVIYSKLGGCLGVTAKLGPLARTDLCAGVKGLLERLMTHLGLGSSLEEPWLDLWGVWRRGAFPGGCTGLRGRLSGLKPGGKPSTLPVCPGGVVLCPAWDALWGLLEAWEELFSSLAVLDLGWGGWGGELLASEWSCAAPGGELLPSPGGRWAIAGVWMWEGTWPIVWLFTWFRSWGGELLASEGSCTAPGGELLPSPGGRWAITGVGRWGALTTCLIVCLI